MRIAMTIILMIGMMKETTVTMRRQRITINDKTDTKHDVNVNSRNRSAQALLMSAAGRH